MTRLENCRKLATRHGDYWHAYPPGADRAVCGLPKPIFPAHAIGHRPICPRCAAYFAGGGVAIAERADTAESEPVVT
jgi:hypothetical protein